MSDPFTLLPSAQRRLKAYEPLVKFLDHLKQGCYQFNLLKFGSMEIQHQAMYRSYSFLITFNDDVSIKDRQELTKKFSAGLPKLAEDCHFEYVGSEIKGRHVEYYIREKEKKNV